jgi:hypothetical protein
MNERVADLSKSFSACLDHFERMPLFTGPSVYFHQKVINRRLAAGSVLNVIQDEVFFDSLYATLTAWGLHRMGSGKTKVREMEEIKSSIRAHARSLALLERFEITSMSSDDARMVSKALWSIVADLRISVAEARIVSNSKTLHHLLPSLMPPIDREYTFNFFFDRTNLSIDESIAFSEMYAHLHRLASDNVDEIRMRTLRGGWHTSESKVIDNAIVGYMLLLGKIDMDQSGTS